MNIPGKIGAKKRWSLFCTYFAISWLVAEYAGNLQKQRHLESIEKEIQEIKFKKRLLLIDINITADTLEEFKTNRPSFEKYIDLYCFCYKNW